MPCKLSRCVQCRTILRCISGQAAGINSGAGFKWTDGWRDSPVLSICWGPWHIKYSNKEVWEGSGKSTENLIRPYLQSRIKYNYWERKYRELSFLMRMSAFTEAGYCTIYIEYRIMCQIFDLLEQKAPKCMPKITLFCWISREFLLEAWKIQFELWCPL